MAQDLTPEELALLNQNHPAAFRRVYAAYAEEISALFIKNVKNKPDTDELISRTFHAFFSEREMPIESNKHLKNYLYKVAKQKLAAYYEKHKKKRRLAGLPDYVIDEDTPSPLASLESTSDTKYSHEIFFGAIEDMSPEDKQILAYHLDGYEPSEIAALMQIKPRRVHDRVYQIKKIIRKKINPSGKNSSHNPLLNLLWLLLFNF